MNDEHFFGLKMREKKVFSILHVFMIFPDLQKSVICGASGLPNPSELRPVGANRRWAENASATSEAAGAPDRHAGEGGAQRPIALLARRAAVRQNLRGEAGAARRGEAVQRGLHTIHEAGARDLGTLGPTARVDQQGHTRGETSAAPLQHQRGILPLHCQAPDSYGLKTLRAERQYTSTPIAPYQYQYTVSTIQVQR